MPLTDLIFEWPEKRDRSIKNIEQEREDYLGRDDLRDRFSFESAKEGYITVLREILSVAEQIHREQPSLLEAIVDAVSDPRLIHLPIDQPDDQKEIWLQATQQKYGTGGFTRSDGQERPIDRWVGVYPALRTLLFLETMMRHPEKVDRLTSDSSQRTHLLFAPLLKKDKKIICQEAAGLILKYFHPELIERIAKIHDVIDVASRFPFDLGKYSTRDGNSISGGWRVSASEGVVTELYNSTERKKEIYTVIENCLQVTRRLSNSHPHAKTMMRTKFPITPASYEALITAIKAYASNQIAWTFEQTKGSKVAAPPLARYTGIEARVESPNPPKIRIADSYTKQVWFYQLGSHRYQDSSRLIPIVVLALDMFYNKAVTIAPLAAGHP